MSCYVTKNQADHSVFCRFLAFMFGGRRCFSLSLSRRGHLTSFIVDAASLHRSYVAVIYFTLPKTKLLQKSQRGSLANPMHERMKRGKRNNGRNIRSTVVSTVVSAATKGAARQEESGERQLWPQFFFLNTAVVRVAINGAAIEDARRNPAIATHPLAQRQASLSRSS